MPKIHFNVDARTAKLIGRENVSNLDGAILELVKNAYDAEASICFLYYEESTKRLLLGDNGSGMTQSIISNHWMTIGNSSKQTNYKTTSGRIQTGAKGIGRFALDRIADKCSLLSISANERLIWSVNWSDFETGQKITDISADLELTQSHFPEFINDCKNPNFIEFIQEKFNKTGSLFCLTLLRDDWNNDVISSIRDNLTSLIPAELKEVFNIFFFEETTSISQAELLFDEDNDNFDYIVRFKVNKDGNIKIAISRNEFYFGTKLVEICREAEFSEEEKEYFLGKEIIHDATIKDLLKIQSDYVNTIGEFKGTLYFNKLSEQRKEKEKFYYRDSSANTNYSLPSGICIFRDGFRVRPYGEIKSSAYDWLNLANRRNKSPAGVGRDSGGWKVSHDQIKGNIFISRENSSLVDIANRQGIVENVEFSLFKDLMRKIIEYFEKDRQFVARKLSQYYDNTHPTAKLEKDIKKVKNETNLNIKLASLAKSIPLEEVVALTDKKDATIRDLETEIKLLRALATIGIVTNTCIHEIKNMFHILELYITLARNYLQEDNDIPNALVSLENADKNRALSASWFDVTVAAVKRDKRKFKQISIKSFLSALVNSWQKLLASRSIKVDFVSDNIEFNCFQYELENIINNLIVNSITAFESSRTQNKNIHISIKSIVNGIKIDYSDTGKGLINAYKKDPYKILEAFETDKRSSSGEDIGTGMGMWIINRIVQEYYGNINLDQNILTVEGFFISIILKNKKG